MIGEHDSVIKILAQNRIKIEQSRLLVLAAARMIDIGSAKTAKNFIAYAKVSGSAESRRKMVC
jgi:alkylation response protein AidB-like acyl-CoA dehydrogenase